MFKDVAEDINEGILMNGTLVNNLRYADDMELKFAQLQTQQKKYLLVSRYVVIEECGNCHGHNKHENIGTMKKEEETINAVKKRKNCDDHQ